MLHFDYAVVHSKRLFKRRALFHVEVVWPLRFIHFQIRIDFLFYPESRQCDTSLINCSLSVGQENCYEMA